MVHQPADGRIVLHLAIAALVTVAFSVGCSSGDSAGPPTLPSGIDRVVIARQMMSGDDAPKTITDPAEIAHLRESINRLPLQSKRKMCITDQGTWTLTFTGKNVSKTLRFDEKGCNEVTVRDADGTTETRQGKEELRDQLTALLS